MFTVYESGIPAVGANFGIEPECWQSASFETYEEAVRYAADWLGNWSPSLSYLRAALANEEEWDYSGCGDTIQIKEG